MSVPPHITIVGFSGTGKSTVAPLVAQRLGWQAIDSDNLIEERTFKTVPQIFEEDGETVFRVFEAEALEAIVDLTDIVVSTGGGAVTTAPSRRAIAEAGLVFCLDAEPTTSLARLAAGHGTPRPLLLGDDPLGRAELLKATRAPLYALADFTVATDALTAETVADTIVRLYREHGEAAFNRPGRVENYEAGLVTDSSGARRV